uniref:Uncharacterized protein n=1 Tax=Arundo donax TaxID=35708 RepID=A0A0A9GSS7_ARUDO
MAPVSLAPFGGWDPRSG